MDTAAITDIKELKATAYDLLAQTQALQRQLEAVNLRIAELSQAESDAAGTAA